MTELEEMIAKIRADRKNHTEVTYNCPECKDTRLITYKIDGKVYAKDCKCSAGEYAQRRMKASGVGLDDIKKGFKDFKTGNNKTLQNARDKALDYSHSFKENKLNNKRDNSLLICGKSGTGKTLLGMATLNNILNTGEPAFYISFRDLINECKESYSSDEGSYQNAIYKYRKMGLLMIDDLFKGGYTEADIRITYDLINARYLACRPMIITTELSRNKLIQIDEAIGSRLLEMAKSHTIFFDDSIPNYRLKES